MGGAWTASELTACDPVRHQESSVEPVLVGFEALIVAVCICALVGLFSWRPRRRG
jgi:hypothetical protein